MLRLSRAVRFSVNDPSPGQSGSPPRFDGASGRAVNGFAAHPPMRGLGRHYELVFECRGEPDPLTGYFLSIADVDRAARSAVIPLVERACRQTPWADPSSLLPALFRAGREALSGRLFALDWRLSPTYSARIEEPDMSRAVLRQSFEFAASHVLHVDTLSAEENRAIFGKCNNPSGHGHNYRLEPAVAVRIDPPDTRFGLADIERVTDEAVIQRLDHKHLNRDVPEFAAGGLNPSVENIARVCYDLLRPAVAAASGGQAELLHVSVWETEKTSCVYPG